MFVLFDVLAMVILVLFLAWAIRERVKVANWLRIPDCCGSQIPDRKTHLTRQLQRLEWEAVKLSWDKEDTQTELDAMPEEKPIPNK